MADEEVAASAKSRPRVGNPQALIGPMPMGSDEFAFRCSHRNANWFGFPSGEIKSYYLDACLDSKNEHPDPGGKVQIKECNGSPNQRSYFTRK